MKHYVIMGMVLATLSFMSMGALSHTSPQKSTIITINGDDINNPVDCAGEFTCLLREAGISFIYARGSDRVTVFDVNDYAAVCVAGQKAGLNIIVSTLNNSHTCS